MFLLGRQNFETVENPITEEGYTLQAKIFGLGHWRKHPDLHCCIIKKISEEGMVDGKPVGLSSQDIGEIIATITFGHLPQSDDTELGISIADQAQKIDSIRIFENAFSWMTNGPNREIEYDAWW